MADIKLVKKSKVAKFPHTCGGVRSTLHDATMLAVKQKWKKVIIIGETGDNGHWFHSAMTKQHVVGMLEAAKFLIQRDALQ